MAQGWQDVLADEVAAWLEPILQTRGDPAAVLLLFAGAGWYIDQLPAGNQTTLGGAVGDIAERAKALADLLAAPPAAIEDFLEQAGEQLVPLAADIAQLVQHLPSSLPADAAELPADVLNWLVIHWLGTRHPAVLSALRLLGIVRQAPLSAEQLAGVVYRLRGATQQLVGDALVGLVTEPATALKDTYWPNGFADGGTGAGALAVGLIDFAQNLSLFDDIPQLISGESIDPDNFPPQAELTANKLSRRFALDDGTDAEVGVTFDIVKPNAGGPGVLATPFGTVSFTIGQGSVRAKLVGTLAANPIRIVPSGVTQTDSTKPNFGATLTISVGDSSNPALQLGDPAGIELSVQEVDFSAEATLTNNKPRAVLGIDLKPFAYSLKPDQNDGFLAKVIPADGIAGSSEVGLQWSTDGGIALKGGGGLSIAIPTHIELGPIEIQQLVIDGKPSGKQIALEISATIAGELGPLSFSVEQMGISALLSFPDSGGNLGPLDVQLGFKPPKGVGLAIDAGVVAGGGYLFIDTERGRYAGALELMVADWLSLTAIGLIDTKMPDGSKGFSLLVIITATFGSGIQLGYGFMLVGVGGLLGLNRTMLFQPLMDGVRTGAINGILFPTDVVANAPKIISDLSAIFPPKKDTFLIGPMAKLSWATLITGSLGVIIEIPPGDVAILGVLQLVLPDDEDTVLLLQVNFAGALEFSKKRLYFFASIYDSRILFITLQGEMGLLVDYGDNPNFVVSVGGFHPQFNPPPLPFPTPNRVQLDILNEDYARISADTYFAVTTNTAQIGAQAQLYFGFSAVSVTGQLSFDALFQFSPFHFTIQVTTSFSANVFGMGVFCVDIEVTLEGTTPWSVHGFASLSFFCFSVDIPIDKTWGDQRNTTLPPIAVIPVLTGELGKALNWKAQLPSGANLMVALRQLDPSEAALVLHPVGTLQVSQRAVPLDLTIDKVGNQSAADANRFRLDVGAGGLVKSRDLQEPFAPAQFRNFSDADKLSQAAYAPQDSGIELTASGAALASATAITRNVRYELTVVDTQYRRLLRQFVVFVHSLFVHFTRGGSAARNLLSATSRGQMQPEGQRVTVTSEYFAVANVADNTAYNTDAVAFRSKASAQDYLERAVRADPALDSQLHVLSQYEVA